MMAGSEEEEALRDAGEPPANRQNGEEAHLNLGC